MCVLVTDEHPGVIGDQFAITNAVIDPLDIADLVVAVEDYASQPDLGAESLGFHSHPEWPVNAGKVFGELAGAIHILGVVDYVAGRPGVPGIPPSRGSVRGAVIRLPLQEFGVATCVCEQPRRVS